MKPAPLFLLVPLAWASFGFAQQAPPQTSSAQAWRQSQKTDAARAMTFTRYTLAGKFPTPPQGDPANRPALTLDCIPAAESHSSKGRFLAGSLLAGSPLKVIYVEPEEIHGTSYYPKVTVRYRIDGAREEEEKWSVGTDKTSVSIPKDVLKKILHARIVAITADDDRGPQISMQFDMPDPKLVEEACNVDYHKE